MPRALPVLALLVSACSDDPKKGAFDCDASGAVCTVAGTGSHGWSGDGYAPTESWLYFPTAVRFDGDRPLIVDYNNQRIRAIEDDGLLWSVAGNGFHAEARLDQLATDSPMENPIDVWPTDAGFLLAEFHTGRILEVSHDGEMRVIAGTGQIGDAGDFGPATEAVLSEAIGIAVADDGSIVISDTDNHRIRAVVDGEIIPLAGEGEPGLVDGAPSDARFQEPAHLAWSDGLLYVADRGNHAIRRIDRENKRVETIVGTGIPGYEGDGGPAVDARLDEPWGVDVGPDGTIWIADSNNHVVRRVDPGGTIHTAVGIGEPGEGDDEAEAHEVGLNLPAHIQVAPDGSIWIADTLNSRIRRYVP